MSARIRRLRNPIQTYAWGSRTAIPELLGRTPSGEPQAELWMGDHPRAPSEIETVDGWRPLDQLRRLDGAPPLPFLFKVLAAETALSIQAHPPRHLAEEGFAREEAAGLAVDAAERSYRDRNAKPEILLALTPFRILRGFRSPAAIGESLRASGLVDALPAARLFAETEAGLRDLVRALLALEGEALARALEAALGWAEKSADDDATAREIQRLASEHPDDRGLLGPLYLRVEELAPGEAAFTPPGVLHAYLGGLGVELMANSDNVLRGGLTRKHVDPRELERILRFGPVPPARLEALTPSRGVRRFEAPEAGLVLTEVTGDGGAPRRLDGTGARILLCVAGEATIRGVDDAGPPLRLARGDSCLVPASVPSIVVDGAGDGSRLFVAAVDPTRVGEL